MNEFISSRLINRRTAYFFGPIKKLNLATFTLVNKIKTCRVNSNVIPLQASKNLFAKIALVAQIRSLNLILLFTLPCDPLPWSLTEPIGTLKKASKAALPQTRRKSGTNRKCERRICMIIDGMMYTATSPSL